MSKYSTPFLSGLRFNCPVSFPRIEMEQINIGDSNVITGFATGINIGSKNSIFSSRNKEIYVLVYLTGITGLGVGQTPFTGITGIGSSLVGFREEDENFNLGFSNIVDRGNQIYNIGAFNSSSKSSNLVQLGLNLESSNLANSTVIGKQNYLLSGNKVLVFGNNNDIYSASEFGILGSNNSSFGYNGNILGESNILMLGESFNANILGNQNTARNSSDLRIIGSANVLSGIRDAIIIGSTNSVNSTGNFTNSNILILGNENVSSNASRQILIGVDNISENNNGNILFGKNISSFGSDSLSFGKENLMRGSNDSIYGKLNVIDSSSQDNFVVGSNNNLSGANSNTIIGSLNISNRNLFDSLYLQELTGITGSGIGQTPFTGITGYRTGGGYDGIDIIGGNSNFFVGDLNQGTLNTSSYIFGKDNKLLNNQDAHVVGLSNYLEKTQNSYVFGSNNTVSGFQNYVIGNNNSVRSGDFNNILLGISHEFTGNFKVASINIASVESSIEINPTEITIKSPSKLLFNNEEVLTSSYAFENILNTDDKKDALVFQDSKYLSLPRTIEVSSFAYSGRGDYLESIFDGRKQLFRKKDAVIYDGTITNISDFYYSSDRFNILFTDAIITGEQQDVWAIGGTGLFDNTIKYYNISTGKNYQDAIPSNFWTTTGDFIDNQSNFNNFRYVDSLFITGEEGARYNGVYTRTGLGYSTFYGLENQTIEHDESTNTWRLFDPTEGQVTAESSTPFFKGQWNHYGVFGEVTSPTGYHRSFGFNSKTEVTGVFGKQQIHGSITQPQHFTSFSDTLYQSSQGFTILYGNHTDPKFDPTWLIVDTYSSGIYYINNDYVSSSIPQTGWVPTGYFNFSGVTDDGNNRLGNTTGINLVMGTRTGVIASNDPAYGRIYIPFFY